MGFFLLSLLAPFVAGLAFDAPAATPVWQAADLAFNGWTPMPTAAPEVHELRKRATETLIVGPDSNCGFISGIATLPFGCSSAQRCGFGTVPGDWGDVYCGSGTANSGFTIANPFTTCLAGSSRVASCSADSSCIGNPRVLLCPTAGVKSLCILAMFGTISVQALYCDSYIVTGTQIISTTYLGGPARAYTTLSGPSSSVSVSSKAAISSEAAASSSPASSSAPSTTAAPIIPTPTQTLSTPDPSGASTPVGAIAGGAVGGVAVLALIGVGIWLCVRRKRKNAAAAGTVAAGQPFTTYPDGGVNNFGSPPPEKLPGTVHQSPVSPNYGYSPQDQYGNPNPGAYSPPENLYLQPQGAGNPTSRPGHESMVSELQSNPHSPAATFVNTHGPPSGGSPPMELSGIHPPPTSGSPPMELSGVHPPPTTGSPPVELNGMSSRGGPISSHYGDIHEAP